MVWTPWLYYASAHLYSSLQRCTHWTELDCREDKFIDLHIVPDILAILDFSIFQTNIRTLNSLRKFKMSYKNS